MLEKLRDDGRKLVTIIDSHSKVNEDYWHYKQSKDKGINVMDSTGKFDYVSEYIPKQSV
jgi:hypothetical protein